MFQQNVYVHDGKESLCLSLFLSLSGPLHKVFQAWTAELARDVLRLGLYFHAVGVFLQIPGATEFKQMSNRSLEEEEGFGRPRMLGRANRNTLLGVLANCLQRLEAESLMEQLAPGELFCPDLPEEWTRLIERRAEIENGLLSLVAECLDSLIMSPGMKEIDQADELYWWHRFRMRQFPFKGAD